MACADYTRAKYGFDRAPRIRASLRFTGIDLEDARLPDSSAGRQSAGSCKCRHRDPAAIDQQVRIRQEAPCLSARSESVLSRALPRRLWLSTEHAQPRR